MTALDTSRLESLADTAMLRRATILVVGAGGVASAVLSLARYGLGGFVLVDPDVVTATNVATSDFAQADVGLPKVESLRRRILGINPACHVLAIQSRFEDVAAEMLNDTIDAATLIWSMTDDVMAALAIDDAGRAKGKDVLHAAMHADNRACDLIGTLTPESASCGGWRDFASSRIALHEAGRPRPPFFFSHVCSANALNNAIEWVTLGLLHHRAGSALPIAAHGANFAKSPCVVIRLDPMLWRAEPEPFGSLPAKHAAFASLQVFRSSGDTPAS